MNITCVDIFPDYFICDVIILLIPEDLSYNCQCSSGK